MNPTAFTNSTPDTTPVKFTPNYGKACTRCGALDHNLVFGICPYCIETGAREWRKRCTIID